jgi:proteasome accessory factor B
MAERVDRLERLVNLTAALLHAERFLSADDLRERVPGYPDGDSAFRRAFERDKEALREAGVPITVGRTAPDDPGSVDGYRIRKADYYLADPGLEPDELAALHLASRVVDLPGLDGREAVWKLGGVVGEGTRAATLAALPGDEHLVALFQAVAERRQLTFGYLDVGRTVDPVRLAFRNGRWALIGFDHTRDDEREFRLDRIAGPVRASAPGAFTRPAAPVRDRAPWLFGEGEPAVVRLLVDADHAAWAVEAAGDEAIEERRPDGTIVLRMAVTSIDGFRSFVLGFLDHAEVLEPAEVRDDLIAWLEAIAEGAPCPE